MAGKGSFASLGAKVLDLDAAWQERREDARILLSNGRTDSAIIQSIYAVEILLKKRICQHLDLQQLPRPFEIHDLQDLLILTGLSDRMKAKKPIEQRVLSNWAALLAYAKTASDRRYQPQSLSASDAQTLWDQLTNPNDGVLTWISTQP